MLKTRHFLCNVNNTDRNGVNKQKHTHTHAHTHTPSPQREREITLERVSMKISDTPFLKQPDLFYQPLHFELPHPY